MNKLTLTLVAVGFLTLSSSLVWAQGVQKQERIQDPILRLAGTPVPFGNQVTNQNQIQTQNQREEKQLRVSTQEQEGLQEGKDEENEGSITGQPKSAAPRSEVAQERMSAVAQAVEELLAIQGAKGGIGEQISQIAREQKQAQQEIEREIKNLEERPNWLERIIGPNYKMVKNLKQQIEQNRLRIQRLEQLKNQLVNRADQGKIQEAIRVMIEQNTALEEQVQAKEKVRSIFGWLVRWFFR